mmetsp:Transcript_28980/g.83739  ORF Transcript_28980/g.83739 Transcript_28980/m.83739 type:complete len:315 (-) Transcript_28980:226-1170(-)
MHVAGFADEGRAFAMDVSSDGLLVPSCTLGVDETWFITEVIHSFIADGDHQHNIHESTIPCRQTDRQAAPHAPKAVSIHIYHSLRHTAFRHCVSEYTDRITHSCLLPLCQFVCLSTCHSLSPLPHLSRQNKKIPLSEPVGVGAQPAMNTYSRMHRHRPKRRKKKGSHLITHTELGRGPWQDDQLLDGTHKYAACICSRSLCSVLVRGSEPQKNGAGSQIDTDSQLVSYTRTQAATLSATQTDRQTDSGIPFIQTDMHSRLHSCHEWSGCFCVLVWYIRLSLSLSLPLSQSAIQPLVRTPDTNQPRGGQKDVPIR